jgi:hypothetical protein
MAQLNDTRILVTGGTSGLGRAMAQALDAVRRFEPSLVLSGHLPANPGTMTDRLLGSLEAVPSADPFVGPDQVALEQLLAEMGGVGPM